MFSIVVLGYILTVIDGFTSNIQHTDLSAPIEKLLLHQKHLYVGTVNSLHRLTPSTLTTNLDSLKLGPTLDNPLCRRLDQCTDLIPTNYHWKILLPTDENSLLICGTLFHGSCQMIDGNFRVILNSSLPIVANDPINSTVGLIIPEKNLIYLGVTYTNEGIHRWQIPNLAGRSLSSTRFMKILSTNNENELITRDDLSVRFMPRQQANFIVQYIFAFYTKNYIYFLTNQPNDLDDRTQTTKIIRFCQENSNSILRSYSEIPLICVNNDWLLTTGQIVVNDELNQQILIGHFTRKDGTPGTQLCSWNIRNDIDRAFEENYRTCYSTGIGQRGLAFIKPNEPCRKDESWSIPINDENLCPWIISERLPYPVGGMTPIIGRLIYESSIETSTTFRLHRVGLTNLVVQGLINSTFKLGQFEFGKHIRWFHSFPLPTDSSILSEILFDNETASIFLASQSKIFRLSLSDDCSSRLSCDECLSSSANPFCGWCTTNQRCTLANDCSSKFWQQSNDQCMQIVHIQPLNASIEHSQWINLTFSKLPHLEHNEIYQCIFNDKTMSIYTQAIKLDHNRLSCPTPSANIHIQKESKTIVRLSVIKWPSNTTIATISEFTFYNCSSYPSCQSCRSQLGCHWCSDRCSSLCTESPENQCSSFNLRNGSMVYLESEQSIEIPLEFHHFHQKQPIECRLNDTNQGLITSDQICRVARIPALINKENDQPVSLQIYQNDISLGNPISMFIFRCDLYESCDRCQSKSSCFWCQGRCLSKRMDSCSTDEQCSSLRIDDFSPKSIPLHGETEIKIYLNELINETIVEVALADIRCTIVNISHVIVCRASPINEPRNGPITIRFSNSIYLRSREFIDYRQTSIKKVYPTVFYEYGGQILRLQGEHFLIGNEQRIEIGDSLCIPMKQIHENEISCRLPPLNTGIYNMTLTIDRQRMLIKEKITITSNPSVQDIDPTISFASGGRLVTVRGMFFKSSQMITVQFSYRKWNARLKVNTNDIFSTDNGILSSFQFRTPSLPHPSKEFPSPPFDVDFSLYFDQSTFAITNLIQFHYIPDVLLNVSSTPPTLPYTGEELKLQVENLTEAASMPDIQLFIGCSECKLKTFTDRGITCQPPTKLITNTAIILNNQQQDDCSLYNASIGPIRFRIGYREYLIGYLSYNRSFSSKYSWMTIISLILASGLLTIAILTLAIYLYFKFRSKSSKKSSLSTKINRDQTHPPLWSTETSASTGPYYQVYEQISCSSSLENTLTRAPLLLCPHYQEKRHCTPPIMEQLQMNSSFLTSLNVDEPYLKKLILDSNVERCFSLNSRRSMELFYDLLHMKPFSQAFTDQLIEKNCSNLFQSYSYLFRFHSQYYQSFPWTRDVSLWKCTSSLLKKKKTDLIDQFHLFDDLLRIVIDFLDSSPRDEILNRSSNSLSSSTLLMFPLQYRSFPLTIDYENYFRFHLSILDCDSIDQIKDKIIRYLNSNEKTTQPFDSDQLDLILPSTTIIGTSSQQTPMIKNYLLTSTIICQTKTQQKKSSSDYLYHLCRQDQLINDPQMIEEKLKENKNRLQPILLYFYQQIAQGLNLFDSYLDPLSFETDQSSPLLFHCYIQLVSDFIRRLNRLMVCRSQCPIVASCLNVIADGLEFIFDTKTEVSSEIELLFMEEKKYFSSFNKTTFNVSPPTHSNTISLPSIDRRSMIVSDDTAIDCLFKLYSFYELYSEPINQRIGENHVSVLLPVHHLLVQIRQLLKSDAIIHDTTLI